VSVSRSIFGLVDAIALTSEALEERGQLGFTDEKTRAIFGRSHSTEPDLLIAQLKEDQPIVEAETLLLRVPNQPGSPTTRMSSRRSSHVAPALVWH
jgi:hypothetical protein